MPKHVRMYLKTDLGFLAGARQQLGKARRGERTAPFRGEDEGRGRLALELPQRTQFITKEGMCCFLATLGAAHIDGAGLELDRRPLQAAELRHPQSVAETDQDHRRVAVAVAVALGRLDQALDLTLGQVLAIATHFAVAGSAKRNCP